MEGYLNFEVVEGNLEYIDNEFGEVGETSGEKSCDKELSVGVNIEYKDWEIQYRWGRSREKVISK